MKKEKVVAFFRFSVLGGIGTLAGLAILYFLTDLLGMWYIASSSLGEVANFFISFNVHKYQTFKNGKGEKTKQELALYLIIILIYLGINIVLMYLFTDICDIQYLISKIMILGILSYPYYLATKKVFPKKPGHT
ncbi:hypothetical protein A3B84_02210 [Candidatus Nomurabacteria bacterium RIFCSPHIGHO2_02_FULL_35_13]|uniref:GtrA/DPMS transmembrane domain-containing protein n=1 Tax=Candidatus Nomurabacteria bacterium RIFCSPHIGHO2_02_FULL_35_13 TaxID=1801748 RepID=A0A1F6VML8_9BACT|nr:MAG: hypothetical protein A3B84_02210 [Candidatus Nomurabacteria bacterium RIFCSPHIGHO2_02_FULL_35_13]